MYNLFIQLYLLGISGASIRNAKAKRWLNGRKHLFEELENKLSANERYIWMHCSSAGEFEQGKPVAEALKQHYPVYKLLLTFFSPSGYEAAKNYAIADVVSYLPLDTCKNAIRFIHLVKPELAIFIKYEFWYHHLSIAARNQIPLLLVSATFRSNQIFFKGYGKFFREMLLLFRHIFVQDRASLHLLQTHGIDGCSISGDTRFDRVYSINLSGTPVPFIDDFIQKKDVLIAGSTWQDDETLLRTFIETKRETKLIIAPHEINEAHLATLQLMFPTALLYSSLQHRQAASVREAQVLIIDCTGLLSRLYQHATVAYIGGGFTRDGIHNILEAAVWGKPVVFGPNYKKYQEAAGLMAEGGGFSIANADELKRLADKLFTDEQSLQAVNLASENYVKANTGATQKILHLIQEKRLLTN